MPPRGLAWLTAQAPQIPWLHDAFVLGWVATLLLAVKVLFMSARCA